MLARDSSGKICKAEAEAGKELDAATIKSVMNWPIVCEAFAPAAPSPVAYWHSQEACFHVFLDDDEDAFPFSPSTDMTAAARVEMRLEELGLLDGYSENLIALVTAPGRSETERRLDGASVFAIAHASPADRCRAALAAVEDRTLHGERVEGYVD